MGFKYIIKLVNKNNHAFVITLIYVIGDYVVRLPIFILSLLGKSVIKIFLAVSLAFRVKKDKLVSKILIALKGSLRGTRYLA